MDTHQSWGVNEESTSNESQVVARVVAMPEGTECKHSQSAVQALIHYIT